MTVTLRRADRLYPRHEEARDMDVQMKKLSCPSGSHHISAVMCDRRFGHFVMRDMSNQTFFKGCSGGLYNNKKTD